MFKLFNKYIHFMKNEFYIDEFSERAVFLIDSEKMSIPEAVNIISKDLNITDLSVEADSIENTVAALYRKFGV